MFCMYCIYNIFINHNMSKNYPKFIEYDDNNTKVHENIFYNNSVTKSNHYLQLHDVIFDPKFYLETPNTIIVPNLFPQIFGIYFELIVTSPNQYDEQFWNKFIEKITISNNNLILWSGSSQNIKSFNKKNIMLGDYGYNQNKFIVLYSLLMRDIIDNSIDLAGRSLHSCLPNHNIAITIETLTTSLQHITNDDIDCKIRISGGCMNEIIPKKFGIKNYHYVKQTCVHNDIYSPHCENPHIKIQFESMGLVDSVEINRKPINDILKFVAIRFNDKYILSETYPMHEYFNEYPLFENVLCVNFDIRQVMWMEPSDTTTNNKYEIIIFLDKEYDDKKYELELYYHVIDTYCLNDDSINGKSIANFLMVNYTT